MTIRTIRKGLAALALAASSAAMAASGLTATGVACTGQGTTMADNVGYVACSGAWAGNDLNQADAVEAQILADWGLDVLAAVDVTGGLSADSGTLSFAAQAGQFVLALKAGNAFSLFRFDAAPVAGGLASIQYDTLGVGFFSGKNGKNMHFGQGLSHASLYSVPVTPVPEPTTLLMMLAGLAAMAFIAVRRRR